jgi:hypothetical protein
MLASRVQFDDNPGVSDRPFLSQSHKRVSVTFFAPITGTVTLHNEPGGTSGRGIVLNAGQSPYHLHVDTHGDCVQRSWYAVYTGVVAPVGFIEALN